MASSRSSFVQLLQLVRFPNLIIMLLCQLLVLLCLLPPGEPLQRLQSLPFWLIAFGTVCIGAAGYIINDYYDVKIDAINKPKRMVVGKSITRRQSMLAHLFLSGIGVLLGLAVSWKVGLINLGAVLLLWGYSDLMKRQLLIGNMVIAVLGAVMLLVVAVPYGSVTKALWAYAFFSFLITLVREIIKDMEDVKGDASFDCRTLPIVAGIAGAKLVLYAILAAFVAFTVWVVLHPATNFWFDGYMLLLVLVPTLFFLKKLIRADRKKDFAYLSKVVKFIMLTGILSMLLL
ncbi:MAG: geranylgeranylglycerol-phosphate geranylgeranyltransferase [Hymenobacteraceae bacterium]|nr:geranylgeranylglycerol-phosphate geranylgeranyltransferase [Hymenobacteraceae bacterium]